MDMNLIVYGVLGGIIGGIVGYFFILIKKLIIKKGIIKKMETQKVQNFYYQKPGTNDDDYVPAVKLKDLNPNESK